ncbi:MAG: hypothetical protein COB09_18415 [Thalassobium sp.]|nr:MAG: hypothetical protein COB09_18415 [Thalassobium sp.]
MKMKLNPKRYEDQVFVDIDFETRSLANIKDVGAMKYAEHPSTQMLIVSWQFSNSDRKYSWNPFTSRRKAPTALLRAIRRKEVFLRAFNSEFEFWIWNLVCVRQFGWPEMKNNRFYDAMGQSVASAFPANLNDAALRSRAAHLKNEDGKDLIQFFSVPIKDTTVFRDPRMFKKEFKQFVAYCDDDVAAQKAVCNATPVLSPAEQDVMFLTEKMNERGIPINVEFVRSALNMVNIAQRRMDKRARAILVETGCRGDFHSLSQRDAVRNWAKKRGLDIPNMQKETIQNFIDEDIISDPLVKEVLQMRLQHAKTSTAKYRTMLAQTDVNGFIHGFIKYHIAKTGRWGGRGMQIQNFPKPGKSLPKTPSDWKEYDKVIDQIVKAIEDEDVDWLLEYHPDIMEILAGYLRAAIQAPKGYKFVSADYGQIEARVVLWIAGSKNGMKDFGGDGKVYEAMAASIYGLNIKKITKDSIHRFIGKQTVLGSGFGMGWEKFITSCWDVAQVRVDKKTAQKAINGYRERYFEVVALWKAAEKAAMEAVRRPGRRVKVNKFVSYKMRGKHLYCKLPSGRELCYPFACIKDAKYFKTTKPQLHFEGKDSKTQQWSLMKTYGGSLVENFVQAIARDIMAHGMFNAEKAGYPTIFSVHDEAAALVKKKFGSVKEYEKLLCILPRWAKGCPVVAEGWQGKYYRK